MSKYLANITIYKKQRKIVIGLYQRNINEDKLVDVEKIQCSNDEEFSKKIEETCSKNYLNCDQRINWEEQY